MSYENSSLRYMVEPWLRWYSKMKWVSILIKVWTSGGILPSFRKNRMQNSLVSFSVSVALTMKNLRPTTKQRFTIFWDILLKSITEQWKEPAGYWKWSETRNEILGKVNNRTMRGWRCSLYRHLSIEDIKAEWLKYTKFCSTCSTKLPVKTYIQNQEILAEVPESWRSENQNRIAETSFLVVAQRLELGFWDIQHPVTNQITSEIHRGSSSTVVEKNKCLATDEKNYS